MTHSGHPPWRGKKAQKNRIIYVRWARKRIWEHDTPVTRNKKRSWSAVLGTWCIVITFIDIPWYNVLNNEIKIGAVSFSLVNHCGHIGRETVLVNDHGRPQNTSARVYRYKLSAECVRITPKVGKINHGIYYVWQSPPPWQYNSTTILPLKQTRRKTHQWTSLTTVDCQRCLSVDTVHNNVLSTAFIHGHCLSPMIV